MVATLPRNGDLADRFELLADLSEILGEQSFRVAAYRRAAVRIRDTASSVAELALEGKAKELPDIGKTIEAKIVEVVETGDMEALAKRRAEVPGEVASFMRPGTNGVVCPVEVGALKGSHRGRPPPGPPERRSPSGDAHGPAVRK